MNTNWQSKIGNAENGFSHHAFLLEGGILGNVLALREFLLTELSIATSGNPDFFQMIHETFGIDEGRELKEMQSRHSFAERGKKIFIIGANVFTIEAQNSLLKVFEEPTEGTHFFVLTPSARFFLPTLLSRIVCIFSEEENSTEDIAEFLKKPYAERLAFALVLAKDSVKAKRFIENMTKYFYEKFPAENRTPKMVKTLEILLAYRTYAYGRSPSLKNIMEHLSLIVPKE